MMGKAIQNFVMTLASPCVVISIYSIDTTSFLIYKVTTKSCVNYMVKFMFIITLPFSNYSSKLVISVNKTDGLNKKFLSNKF